MTHAFKGDTTITSSSIILAKAYVKTQCLGQIHQIHNREEHKNAAVQKRLVANVKENEKSLAEARPSQINLLCS